MNNGGHSGQFTFTGSKRSKRIRSQTARIGHWSIHPRIKYSYCRAQVTTKKRFCGEQNEPASKRNTVPYQRLKK